MSHHHHRVAIRSVQSRLNQIRKISFESLASHRIIRSVKSHIIWVGDRERAGGQRLGEDAVVGVVVDRRWG
ncbi:hypothetical protein HanIR_Chr04g0153501 [Helianthus annuus]|nr:hypothetical protein HanIR_Chr04g0153501 [Helianthus annuus]